HDQLVVELSTLLHDTDSTAVLVTHDVHEARSIADRTVLLDNLGGTS
ncbi:MAG: ABC-type nitrate/sulfonate/bicarbonate transport system ATPase subunit, partial [Ilumatobacter sp.]